ncbi:MAG: hypothetical protein Q9172_000246 [Xanthocarpia lactea]
MEATSTTSDDTCNGQANITALQIPAAFKVELVSDPSVPIDSEEIYQTAADMMYQVTDHPLMQQWLGKDWKSPLGDSGIYIRPNSYGKDPSRLYTQYIIWGLNHILLSMTLLDRYCQTTAVLKYQGNPVGAIHVARTPPVGESWSPQQHSALAMFKKETPGSLTFTDVDIKIAFGATPVAKKLIYLTTIKAMGEACEKGLRAVVPRMLTTGIQQVTWKLMAMSRDQPTIEAGYSRIAVIKTLAKMVVDDHFSEVFVWAKVNGRAAGIGGFTQGTSGFSRTTTA